MIIAAIDIGSNSTNLLITESTASSLMVVDRLSNTTRLGAGVDVSHQLTHDSMSRTLEVLAAYRTLIDHRGVSRTRVVASSACRDATNSTNFFDQVTARTRFEVDVLSGEDEGRLAYRGALSGMRSDPMGNLVIDIGGGSTELIRGGDQVEMAHSIDVGAVRLTDRHLRTDPPRPEDLTNAIGDVIDLVDDIARIDPAITGRRQVIGVGGTIETIAAVEIGGAASSDAQHGFVLSRTAVEEVFRTLATEPLPDRVHNPGLPADRADIVVGGCCVLVGLMRRLRLDEIIVSSHDIRDGICLELLEEASR